MQNAIFPQILATHLLYKIKYFYTLPPVFIGVSMVLVQSQVAVALSQQEVEQIGREITVWIVNTQDPTVSGSGVLIKHSGDTYTVLTAYHVVKDGGIADLQKAAELFQQQGNTQFYQKTLELIRKYQQ
ncbi:hypothetical protein [Fischerella sp. JS2]|uniref:hypothetical protein n=1 Tax=Fischerella sp. JS2 TaxID=2597771 RepID=UPI0028EA0759|nr:hypothetical protein [Fischerella sp. JS2]